MESNSISFGHGDLAVDLPLLVSSDEETRVLHYGDVYRLVSVRGERQIRTPLTFPNGREGFSIFGEDWKERYLMPDGSYRAVNALPGDGACRVAYMAAGMHQVVPVAPKISKETLDGLKIGMEAVKGAFQAIAEGKADIAARREKTARRCLAKYQREGRAKLACIAVNQKFDDKTGKPLQGDDRYFDRPEEARRRYGVPVPMFAL